jgi:hypothetical protein
MGDETFESQRYGRNKKTQIDKSYINSGNYRRKFDGISNNPELNKKLYELSKEMLQHRSGTLYEDMYWLNPDTSEIIAYEVNGLIEEEVDEELFAAYVKKYRLEGKTEFEAQWNALESIKENTDIVFKEVGAYE